MNMPTHDRVPALQGACLSAFFNAPAFEVAQRLIGMKLLIGGVGGSIVETEAYDGADPASHSFNGRTLRNAPMFGPPGHAYVYRSYGLHWCLNFVCQEEGHGAAVLIRALEPTDQLEIMKARRGVVLTHMLCAGPGRLAQALGVDAQLNGQFLGAPPFALFEPNAPARSPVDAGRRIGISKGVDLPWRFAQRGSRFLSKPMPPGEDTSGSDSDSD